MPPLYPRLQRHGLTLVEILAVVVILGLLAATLTVGILGKLGRARSEIAKTQIAYIVSQIQTFELERRSLPAMSEGLKALAADSKAAWYLSEKRLVDPWGRPYQYLVPGPAGHPYEVISLGADGLPGGEGEDADVTSGDL